MHISSFVHVIPHDFQAAEANQSQRALHFGLFITTLRQQAARINRLITAPKTNPI